jgi:hypothetical protein
MHISAGAGVDVGGAHTGARISYLHQKQNGFFQALDYLFEEFGALRTINAPVIDRQADGHGGHGCQLTIEQCK